MGPPPISCRETKPGGWGRRIPPLPAHWPENHTEKSTVLSGEVRKELPSLNLACSLLPLFNPGYLSIAYIVAIRLFFQAVGSPGDNSSGLSPVISQLSWVTLVKLPKLFFHRVTNRSARVLQVQPPSLCRGNETLRRHITHTRSYSLPPAEPAPVPPQNKTLSPVLFPAN